MTKDQMGNCSDKTVLVVGGGSGIGLSIARGLKSAGARVATLSRQHPADGQSGEIGRTDWLVADLSIPGKAREVIRNWIARNNVELDAVFFTAVAYGEKRCSIVETDVSEWDYLFRVNVSALHEVLQATIMDLTANDTGGLVVSLTSEVVFNGGPLRSSYAASKAGAFSLVKSAGEELRGTGVRVVQLMPKGMVDTPGIRKRRPAGFNYSEYSSSDSFIPIAISLVSTLGHDTEDHCLVVDENGLAVSVKQGIPGSQSKLSQSLKLHTGRSI